MDSRILGVLGGGQLGRMMAIAAHRLGIQTAILDPNGSASPAGQIAHLALDGSFTNSDKIKELSQLSDLITTEIEHVDTKTLLALELDGYCVNPNGQCLEVIQDKLVQRNYLSEFAQPKFCDVPDLDTARRAGSQFGYPFMLKCRRLAYDGRGNAVVHSESELESVFCSLNGGRELFAEQFVQFVKELAVMVVRTIDAKLLSFPVVETIQVNNICHLVIAPAQISPVAMADAQSLAVEAVSRLGGVGIFGVEMYLLDDESVLLNEIAPRPHNSGHYTIEACDVDQFEMHVRAVMGLPCYAPSMKVPYAAMINVLGSSDDMSEVRNTLQRAAAVRGCGVHWYGKSECRAGRKMAHITVTADSLDSLRDRLEALNVTEAVHGLPCMKKAPKVGIIMGSDWDLQTMRSAAEIMDYFNVAYELTIVSAHRTPLRMVSYAETAAERGLQIIIAGAGGAAHLPGMVAALTTLPVIGVPVRTETFGGNDSLLSIVQMPRGVPVATVAIGNATNAGLLAVRMLAMSDNQLSAKLQLYVTSQEEVVLEQAEKLETVGYKQYMDEKKNQQH